MPYYGEGLPYYYGGAFANHSSLMTGTPRSFHTPLSRFSPHLSTISESPLSTLRRYSPVPVPSRPRRVIDTADIDVSTPRVHSGDGTHPRNRLRRDRPTIKIRSQALKDNPALREHNERHEKTVGELLVEKFLIKDKKLDDAAERQVQLFHQVSLDREEKGEGEDNSGVQQQAAKITRRFTRRRSSADIQLDPEQLEKEIAYAQVEAKVLDSLVAEEQAEIENEVRRGTLIKKGTVVGRKSGTGFFRALDKDTASASASASQGEEDSATQKIRKSLKKVKKKKRSVEKPPDDDNERERGSSTSSDASVDLHAGENKERKLSRSQAFKIEASNSVGDFSTVWVNADSPSVTREQFRESVKIPVPRRKMGQRKTEPDNVETVEESEPEVVLLPVKKSYVKDTSRISVHCTVKTPPETLKSDPMDLKSLTNGVTVSEKKGKVEKPIDTSKKVETETTTKDVSEDVVTPKKMTNGVTSRKMEKETLKDSAKVEESKSSKEDNVPGLKKELKQSETLKNDSPKNKIASEVTLSKREKETLKDFAKVEESKISKEDDIQALKKEDALKQALKTDSPKTQKTNGVAWRKREKSESLEDEGKSKSPKDDVVPELKKEDALKQALKTDSPKTQETNGVAWRKREKSESLEDEGKSKSPKDDVVPELKKENAVKQTLKTDSPKTQKTNGVGLRKREKSETSEEPKSPKEDGVLKKNVAMKQEREGVESVPDSPKEDKETPKGEQKSPEALRPRNREPPAPKTGSVVSSSATLAVDPLASENSASLALPSAADRLPKPSKITTDENNAVEAPKPALRGPEQRLAKATKTKRDEDVGDTLPGNKTGRAATLSDAHTVTSAVQPSDPEHPEIPSEIAVIDDATGLVDIVTKSTFSEKTEDSKSSLIDDAANNKVNKSVAEEEPKGPFRVIKRPAKIEPVQFPWRKKKVNETPSEPKDPVSSSEQKSPNKTVTNESLPSKIPVDKQQKVVEYSEDPQKPENTTATATKTEDSKTSLIEDAADTKVNRSGADEEPKGQLKAAKRPAKTEQVPWRKKKVNESKDLVTSPEPKSPKKIVCEETAPSSVIQVDKQKVFECLNGETGNALSKSTSTESIDFWSEIKGPDSPLVTKVAKGLSFPGAMNEFENPAEKEEQLDKKKESVAKISVAGVGTPQLSNVPVIGQEPEEPMESVAKTGPKEPKKRKNLSIQIDRTVDAYSTIKKTPLRREDSVASTISGRSVGSTPDTSVPGSQVATPVYDVSVPLINIVDAATPTNADQPLHPEEDDEARTPTNEWPDSGLSKMSKWENHSDLSNVDQIDKDATPVPSKVNSVVGTPDDTPQGTPESSKKKKVVRKKKASTTKKSSGKDSKKESKKEAKDSKKSSAKSQESLKPAIESKSSSKANQKQANPSPKPLDLIRMFYTTPSALLTATPRDLSKVRRAKIKRRKHHSRTPSVSSDSTGSTTSTATTGSTDGSRSTCTELDEDPDKRMNSTRSNDSGFDGSPRISTPSQSSDTQRNSDSSDHFPSGRITPPATNLPRFKKYAVTDFNFRKVLGKGSFGKVLLAELKGTECVYAVKCLKKDVVLEDDDVECTLIERKVLTLATRHPYLCHLFCTFQTESHLFFVMEYLNGGDLMFHIQKSGRFSETRARFYAAEIWSGLNFLHKKGIVYRDLKLDNVLLDFEGHIRIADFGMCKLQIFLDRTADTFCGTPDYMAPEIIKGLKYNQAVDWWSYGVLLYEMLTGQSPFSGCDEDELFWSICNERPFIPRYLSQDSTDMLLCLLEKDSGKRLPGHDIAYHAFFQSLPWDRLERRQLEPPFKPALEHTLDTKYFDTAFTAERPRLTPVPEQILTSMDQGVFRGFSYTNPNATD
ncbi:uncharacterized protein LOC143218820 [Lasioglossum baleicum]|uniref:uncharacterized protein LOC143218820 n=1 Tax=Lasioglossum baleicum TaxID=434251 RepID=UPI003FCD1DD8